MSLIYKLTEIIEVCRKEHQDFLEDLEAEKNAVFKLRQLYGRPRPEENLLAWGDNLHFMKYLLEKGYGEKLQLIYADPPFFSKADYKAQVKIYADGGIQPLKLAQPAYTDTWSQGLEDYLRMLTSRLFLMRDLLAPEGCIWLHLDWHVVHYVKILMDEIFGMDNFVNEIIWQYKSGGSSKRHFARKHDTLLFYGKSPHYYFAAQQEKSYNRGLKPYRFKGVEEFEDDIGWHTLVNMKDVWQLDMVGRTASERTGYATQKPELLLERILTSCSRKGDLCADFFGGSGTLAATAHKLERRWVTCDTGKNAVAAITKRLLQREAHFRVLQEQDREEELGRVEFCLQRDENRCQVEISRYHLQEEAIQLFGEEDQALIRQVLRRDSLSLLDCWSVDFQYDGQVHRPQQVFLREKDSLKCQAEGPPGGRIHLCVTDVFGHVSSQTL
ncbi:site-specific DNA-methyltransferase [Aminipila butyrica]|uniref:Site-specific DNA-methyltransferase n=1 Tax=Aminipila butyrica TaxID=433296 RepID=A0A858BUY1_9FIRM|nr:site-specific DNA-methyltransferase [Aminipila butyrica]QIB69192.1 site-specific DNA-methyltransferase [Aminipila butyrica]